MIPGAGLRSGEQIAFYLPTDVEPGRGITPFGSCVMRSSTRNDVMRELVTRAGDRTISTRVAGRYPAAEAAAANVRLEQGKLRGRLVLEF